MIDSAARTDLIAALEKISAARSGRVHCHGIPRASAAATYGADRLSADMDFDLIFNNDQPAVSFIVDTGSESARGDLSSGSQTSLEKRLFLDKGLVYQRVAASGSDNDQDGDGQADELEQWDSDNGPGAELWIAFSSELAGINLAEQVPPTQTHFAWLIAALSDPAHEVSRSIDAAGQTSYTTSVRADQLADGWEEFGCQYKPSALFGVRLRVSDGELTRFILDTPPDRTVGAADLFESFETNYWRMNEPITIVEPTADECWPPVPPIHTTIASCHLAKSNRYISFEWGGRECTDRLFWKDEDEEPYVPLAVGDSLCVTGSSRPYFGAKSDKTITATIWAAFTSDGRTILDARPFDRETTNPRRLAYYDRVTDIVDRSVVLNDITVIAEPVQIHFAAPIRASDSDLETIWEVARATVASLGLAEGTPVIVRAYDSAVGRCIIRVSLEDGTPIPGELEMITREASAD